MSPNFTHEGRAAAEQIYTSPHQLRLTNGSPGNALSQTHESPTPPRTSFQSASMVVGLFMLRCRGVYAPSLMAWLFFSLTMPSHAQDLFLFGGQSNMVGNPTSLQAVEDGRSLFEDILQLEGSALAKRISEAQPNAQEAATRTARAVTLLKDKGVLDGLLEPMPDAYCVWNRPELMPLEAYSRCGREFGPELTFAHSLHEEVPSMYATPNQPLHIRKAAVGGKALAEFLPGQDTHTLLLDVLDGAEPTGVYRAFVWYQGENDVLEETSTQEYMDNFLHLVDIITARMYKHGETASAFTASTQIPVIVVKLGHWPGPGTPERSNIDRAHQGVVDHLLEQGRPAAVVEGLDQYSQFYHLDPASYLIAGDLIAQAYLKLTYVDPSFCGFICRIERLSDLLLSPNPFT